MPPDQEGLRETYIKSSQGKQLVKPESRGGAHKGFLYQQIKHRQRSASLVQGETQRQIEKGKQLTPPKTRGREFLRANKGRQGTQGIQMMAPKTERKASLREAHKVNFDQQYVKPF